MRKYLFPLFFAVAGLLSAQDAAPAAKPKFVFKSDPEKELSALFPEIHQEARRLNQTVFDALAKLDALVIPTRVTVEEGFPLAAFAAFGRLVRTDAGGKLLAHNFAKLDVQLDYFESVLGAGEKYPEAMPVLTVGPKLGPPPRSVVYYFAGKQQEAGELSAEEAGAGITVTTARGTVDSTRLDALDSLGKAIYPYQQNANSYTAFKTRGQLLELADDWDDYFDQSRPQTFWDIAATTLLERRHFQADYLVGPPARQWFVLHPNVVIENLDAAPDGDQLGGAMAIEWIGVNWWKGIGSLKVPIGLSLSSLYSDRPGVDDVGHGVTLYFANRYCVGWASHGGDNGFFVSIDLLKLIDSKKSKLEQYRAKAGELLLR